MSQVDYLEVLRLAAPETITLATALVVLAVDLLVLRDNPRRVRQLVLALVAAVGCAAAAGWIAAASGQYASILESFTTTAPSQIVKAAILIMAAFTVLLATESEFTRHFGEFTALVLLAAIGMMFLISSENLLLLFVSLELTSLSLYILAGFNKGDRHSAEAALKYFLFGAVSAAVTLFGFSLIYGSTASIHLPSIGRHLASASLTPLLTVALVMTVIGFGFKVAAVPFHLWAPDVYQGAPTSSAAFIASGSKVASFFVFAKVLLVGLLAVKGVDAVGSQASGWLLLLAVMATLSMVLGNMAAIAQTSVKRLLAYSAIAHAGYMLLGIMGLNVANPALLYYAITYGFTTIGAFGVVSVVEAQTGGDRLSDFAGLARREPLLSFSMLIFMLSLAGIPPLAGFFGKFFVFAAVLRDSSGQLDLLWLVVLALAMSAVSLYYYLIVLKKIYVAEGPEESGPARCGLLTRLGIGTLALMVILLGCFPDWLLARLAGAF